MRPIHWLTLQHCYNLGNMHLLRIPKETDTAVLDMLRCRPPLLEIMGERMFLTETGHRVLRRRKLPVDMPMLDGLQRCMLFNLEGA